MKIYQIVILLAMISLSCTSDNSKKECIEEYIEGINSSIEYQQVIKAANDAVLSWEQMNIRYSLALKRSNWKIDNVVLFNESKTRALLLLLKIDKDANAVLDNAKMLAAEKKDGVWYIYSSMPTIGFNRKKLETQRQYTYEELRNGVLNKMISGGLLKRNWECNIDNSYINDWFFGAKDLSEKHQKFLRDTIQ